MDDYAIKFYKVLILMKAQKFTCRPRMFTGEENIPGTDDNLLSTANGQMAITVYATTVIVHALFKAATHK